MDEVCHETDRLILRVPVMDDVDALSVYWADPETMKYIGSGDPWDRSKVKERVERAIATFENTRMCFWTVCLRECGTIIGQGGLVPIAFDGDEVELGYRLGRPHWGKGYATEIAMASARHGLFELGHDELVAVTYPENAGSRKVLSKTGFEEGGLTDRYYETTCIRYALSRSRWESLHLGQ